MVDSLTCLCRRSTLSDSEIFPFLPLTKYFFVVGISDFFLFSEKPSEVCSTESNKGFERFRMAFGVAVFEKNFRKGDFIVFENIVLAENRDLMFVRFRVKIDKLEKSQKPDF